MAEHSEVSMTIVSSVASVARGNLNGTYLIRSKTFAHEMGNSKGDVLQDGNWSAPGPGQRLITSDGPR